MSNKSAINVEERQDAFLKVYPTAGTITSAAKSIGVNRRTVHTWFKTHPEFSERFEQARQGFVEELENIAFELGKEMDVPIEYIDREELASITTPNPSKTVQAFEGTSSVSEAAALKSSSGELIVEKQKFPPNLTIAIARIQN